MDAVCLLRNVSAKSAKNDQLSNAGPTVLAKDRCDAFPASAHSNKVIIGMMMKRMLFPWRVVRGLECVQ